MRDHGVVAGLFDAALRQLHHAAAWCHTKRWRSNMQNQLVVPMHSRRVIQAREHHAICARMLRGFEKVVERLDVDIEETGARYAPASVHSSAQLR